MLHVQLAGAMEDEKAKDHFSAIKELMVRGTNGVPASCNGERKRRIKNNALVIRDTHVFSEYIVKVSAMSQNKV